MLKKWFRQLLKVFRIWKNEEIQLVKSIEEKVNNFSEEKIKIMVK